MFPWLLVVRNHGNIGLLVEAVADVSIVDAKEKDAARPDAHGPLRQPFENTHVIAFPGKMQQCMTEE